MNPNELQQIEVSIEHAEEAIAKADALERLYGNPDFKLVILEGYYVKEASRIVMLKGDPNTQGENEQAQMEKIIIGIGAFRQYLNAVYQMAAMAQSALKEDRATREELLEESLGD